MTLKNSILFFLFLAFKSGYAQNLDSLILNTDPSPYLSLDSRNTVVQNNGVRFFGIKAGLDWDNKVKLGFGYYTMTTKVNQQISYEEKPVKSELKFNYATLNGNYRFYSSKKWTFHGILHNGFGNAYYVPIQDKPSLPGRIEKQFIWLLEPQINARYNILNWLALGGALGFRKTLIPDFLKTNNFNGGTVSLSFQIFPVEAYKALKSTLKTKNESKGIKNGR